MHLFSFGKKKTKTEEEDDSKYTRYGGNGTSKTLARANSTYFPVSQEEQGRKRRRMCVNLLLAITLTRDIEMELLFPVSKGFDLPLVIGEQFICKVDGKKFQSASYNDCLEFILTTLYEEGHEFAKDIYLTLVAKLTPEQKCHLAYHGFECKTRTWRFHEYKNCFVGKEAVSWLVDNHLCRTREQAVNLGNYWLNKNYIKHTNEQRPFEDLKLFYRFNDGISFIGRMKSNHANNIRLNKEKHDKALSMMMDPNDIEFKELQGMSRYPTPHDYDTSFYQYDYGGNGGFGMNMNMPPPMHINQTPSNSSRMRFGSTHIMGDPNIKFAESQSPRKKHSFTLPTLFGGGGNH